MKSDETLRRAWNIQLQQQRQSKERKLQNLRTQESNLQRKLEKTTRDLQQTQDAISKLLNEPEETFESFRSRVALQSLSEKSL